MRRTALGVAVALITFMVGGSAAGVWKYFTRKPIQLNCDQSHRFRTVEANPAAEAEIRELFKQFAEAQTNLDASFFERVEADSYTVTARWGQTFTKAEIIADMKTWDRNTKYAYESLDVQVYGDVAVVKGVLTATENYRGHSSGTTWQSIYLLTKRTGEWQILSAIQVG
ncbi:MAG TPA: nuclear transport factor 2 family protein [Pyrinomonadaceae bacterium]|nr:nuclear transport factor 2 family protein [Pyrinomonadaceae bacterium]